jgi:hypothetical protein
MKYILIEHSDGNDPKRLQIFDTVDARARATREAILGPPDDANEGPCPELLKLSVDGIVHFEGDPSIEWIDAEVGKTEREHELEELVRAACCIAERSGQGTHWNRFINSVAKVGLNGVTARTYRILESDVS